MENLALVMLPKTRGATITAAVRSENLENCKSSKNPFLQQWTVDGASGPTTAHAAPLVEEEARGKQGSVTTQHLLVGGDSALGLQIKLLTATPSAVVFVIFKSISKLLPLYSSH